MSGIFVESLLWHLRGWDDEVMIEALEIDRDAGVARITLRPSEHEDARVDEIELDEFRRGD